MTADPLHRSAVTVEAPHGDPPIARASWRTWGTGVAVAVDPPEAITDATRLLQEELAAMDAACNRFRPDADLSSVNRAAGSPVRVGPLCLEAIQAAVVAARRTEGAVDPTVGAAVCALGYDRDFDELAAVGAGPAGADTRPAPEAAPGWRSIVLDPDRRTVVIPAGAALDLGATAKALCADRAAKRIADELGVGVVVDLGGDLSAAGQPPEGGWQVAVVEDARRHVVPDPRHAGPSVSLWRGGLATSGTSVRTWRRGDRELHHIVDPATGWPAPPVWRQVTVAARSCVEANTASTAAVVWAEDGPFRVGQMGLAARFVAADGGEVLEVGDWPASAATSPSVP